MTDKDYDKMSDEEIYEEIMDMVFNRMMFVGTEEADDEESQNEDALTDRGYNSQYAAFIDYEDDDE